jgi:general secretion pathway protein K
MPAEHGVALVLVLWVLTLLTIMVSSFALGVRRETRLTANIRDKAQAIALAEAGIIFAQLHLLTTDKQQRWQASGHIYPLNFKDAKIRIRIESEAGKIAINQAKETLLMKMLLQTNLAENQHQAIVNAILDWRDADDLIRIEGAEKNSYRQAGLLYEPRNKPFQTIEELRLVLGVSAELFAQLKPMITVYSTRVAVDLTTANQQVLVAVTGLAPEVIDDYIAQRIAQDNKNLPLRDFPQPSAKKNNRILPKIYTIIAETQLNNGTQARVQVVLKQNSTVSNNPFVILNWKRYADLTTSLFAKTMDFLLITEDAEFNP